MDRPFKPKYGTVSQVLLQLVVACNRKVQKLFLHNFTRAHPEVYVFKDQIQLLRPVLMYLCTNVLENLQKKKRTFRASKAIDCQMTSLPSLLSVSMT